MNQPQTKPITAEQTVAELASTEAGASRVFHRHGLDFCCHGHVPLDRPASRQIWT